MHRLPLQPLHAEAVMARHRWHCPLAAMMDIRMRRDHAVEEAGVHQVGEGDGVAEGDAVDGAIDDVAAEASVLETGARCVSAVGACGNGAVLVAGDVIADAVAVGGAEGDEADGADGEPAAATEALDRGVFCTSAAGACDDETILEDGGVDDDVATDGDEGEVADDASAWGVEASCVDAWPIFRRP